MSPGPTVLLLSAYEADSHRAWADWLCRTFDDYRWNRLTLPGRHFRWRIRGNPLSWLDRIPTAKPDLVLATSMVDLATLRGLHPHLADAPSLYYFHENQFAYPATTRQSTSVDPQMVQLYGALAADRVVFNSGYNRDSFLAGVDELLARLPDELPDNLVVRLGARSSVCPVAVDPVTASSARDPKLILWNHRWEYDKCPERFADVLCALAARGLSFRVALLGPRPHRTPPPLQRLRDCLGDRIVADGRLPGDAYHQMLTRAGIVVSTAIHEFQGLSVMQAAMSGATPLVPDSLCYPEIYPPEFRYPAGDIVTLTARLESMLHGDRPPPPGLSDYATPALKPRWRALLQGLLGARA